MLGFHALNPRSFLIFVLFWCLVELSCPESVKTDERISIAFVFWYTPDHGDFTVTPYWHDPGFRCHELALYTVFIHFSRLAFAKPVVRHSGRSAIRRLTSTHSIDVQWFNLAEEGTQAKLRQARHHLPNSIPSTALKHRLLPQEVSAGRFHFVLAKGCWHTPAGGSPRAAERPLLSS